MIVYFTKIDKLKDVQHRTEELDELFNSLNGINNANPFLIINEEETSITITNRFDVINCLFVMVYDFYNETTIPVSVLSLFCSIVPNDTIIRHDNMHNEIINNINKLNAPTIINVLHEPTATLCIDIIDKILAIYENLKK